MRRVKPLSEIRIFAHRAKINNKTLQARLCQAPIDRVSGRWVRCERHEHPVRRIFRLRLARLKCALVEAETERVILVAEEAAQVGAERQVSRVAVVRHNVAVMRPDDDSRVDRFAFDEAADIVRHVKIAQGG